MLVPAELYISLFVSNRLHVEPRESYILIKQFEFRVQATPTRGIQHLTLKFWVFLDHCKIIDMSGEARKCSIVKPLVAMLNGGCFLDRINTQEQPVETKWDKISIPVDPQLKYALT